ncbi:hypothetical protein FRC02_010143 [Tulasnella sp. 418]|nr:hypothetical protein FRC02_010143 [Tulasnella sp. 418]
MKMSSRQDKATFYRHKTQLNELVARPENKHCADCKKHAPRWASWNIGVFICLRCSVIHRTLGAYISKVKSLDSDVWIPDQIALLTIWGNAHANLYWEARLKTERVPPEHKIESFIRNKYELRRWAMDGQPPSDPSVLEQGAEEPKAEAEPAESVALTSSSTPPHSTNSSVSSCSAHSLPSPTITTVSPQTPSVTSSDKENPISTSSKWDHVERGKDTEIIATEIAHLDIGEIDLTGKIDQGRQITWGNYSDVWHGTLLKDDGKAEVAIKALRVRHSTNRISKTPNEERLYKRFYREALLWAKLRHPNVTPLLGYTLDPDGVPSLVSPWYPNGNLIEYLTSHPNANRPSLVRFLIW